MKSFQTWRWWTVALRGVVAILFGLLALFSPTIAMLSIVLMFGIYAIVDGVLAISLAAKQAAYPRGMIFARGLVSIVAGVLALAWPGLSTVALIFVIASWAVVAGIFEVGTAITMRKQLDHEWLLALEGGLSIAFGVLLFLSPLAGAIVLGLWVGAYALVLGGVQVSTGLRLRSYNQTHPLAAAA